MDLTDISKYEAFFHDGYLKNMQHKGNKIILTMSSAEMDEKDLFSNIELSKDDLFQCLRGKLHIEGV